MHVPHHLVVYTPDMQFEITPASCGVITLRIRAIKTQKDERLFHHIAGLKVDHRLRVPVRDHIRCVRRK
jgi:hypothetical protein